LDMATGGPQQHGLGHSEVGPAGPPPAGLTLFYNCAKMFLRVWMVQTRQGVRVMRSCGYVLHDNILCPKCGRGHYDPGRRKVCTRWGKETRVRVLKGPMAGKMGEVQSVGREKVYVRFFTGTKRNPDSEEYAYTPDQLKRSSGPKAMFP
jgi:hypothetical protein